MDEELKEWRKNTVATQRAFATTMLTTSSGGVAIYFAVLKYLGWEQANFSAPLVVLTVLPPALFLLAALAFALALWPSLSYVDRDEFAEFRAHLRRDYPATGRSCESPLYVLCPPTR